MIICYAVRPVRSVSILLGLPVARFSDQTMEVVCVL